MPVSQLNGSLNMSWKKKFVCDISGKKLGPTEAQTQRTNSCRKIYQAPVHPPTPTEAQYYSPFTMPSLSLSLSFSHTRALYLYVSLSLSLCLWLSSSLSLFLTLSHTHTHISHVLRYCRFTLAQYPQNHTHTAGQHLATLQLPTTGQHVVKTLKAITLLQVTMSPPRHIAYSLLLHVYRSTRRQNLQNTQNHTNTTGHHFPTSPHRFFSTTTYHRSSKPSESYQYYRSPCPHLAISLIL